MQSRRGWTIIELVVVMVVLAIVGMVSFATISSYRTQHLRAAAERIADDLRYAKNLAQASAAWHGVTFNVSPTNTYSVYETTGSVDTTIKMPQDPGRDFVVSISNDYGGVAISGVNIDGGSKVEFDPYGAPYVDKTGAALAAEGVITLSLSGTTLTVCVALTTGRIYIQ